MAAIYGSGMYVESVLQCQRSAKYFLKADSHIACRAHAVPLPFRADKGLECVFPT